MKKLFILLKLQLSSLFGLSVIRYGKDEKQRKKARNNLVMVGVVAVVCVIMSFSYSMLMAQAFVPMGMMDVMLSMMLIAATLLTLISSIARVKSILFSFGDYDLMMSLPISTTAVATARLLSFYVLDLLFAAALLIPSGIVYGLHLNPSWTFYLILVIMTLFAPIIPLAIGGLLGTLLGALMSRFKYKTAASTIVQLLFVMGVMVISFTSSSWMENIGDIAAGINGRISGIYPLAQVFTKAVIEADIASILIFIGVSVVLGGLFSLLVMKRFKQISTVMRAVYRSRNFRLTRQEGKGKLRALYGMEWRRYSSCTIYFLNTAFSSIMLLLAIAYVGIFGRNQIMPMLPVLVESGFEQYFAPVFATLMSWLLCMSVSTAASISIEGKRLWLAKLIPVRASDWLKAKLMVSLTLPVPTAIICAVVLTFALQLNPLAILQMLLIVMPSIYLISLLGLFVNLKNHRFDWKSEQEIVKQGTPILIVMLISMAATIIPIVLAFVIGKAWICYAFALTYIIISLLLGNYLWKNAERFRATL